MEEDHRKLAGARYHKGWSQEKVAEVIGVTRSTLSQWERGVQKPQEFYVHRLCTFYEMTRTELGLEESVHRKPAPLLSASELSRVSGVNRERENPPFQDVSSQSHNQSDLFTVGITALLLHQQQQQWSILELEQRVTQALDEMVPDMQNFHRTSRRSVFQFIASLPFALQHFANGAHRSPFSFLEEVLPFYAAGIPACWRLYYEGGQTELERVLPEYLSHLTKLVQEPSTFQKNMFALLSQAHQLMALLEQGRENFGHAIKHCQHAAFYGGLAEDSNLRAMALIRQFDTCKENKRIAQSLHLLKEAESFSDHITPLLRGRIFARLSYAYAHQSSETEAYRYLDLAQNIFPSHPESDTSFLYNHTTHFVLYANEALTYMNLGHPERAWKAIQRAGEFVDPTNPRKIDLTHHQIQIAIALDDLEQSCSLFERLIGFVKQDGHTLDMDNTYDLYQHVATHWPGEKHVRQLEATLHL